MKNGCVNVVHYNLRESWILYVDIVRQECHSVVYILISNVCLL